MSHMEYFNFVVEVNERIYDSHVELISKICNELGHPERASELTLKYLDEKTKLKAKKDKNRPKKPKTSYFFFMMEVRDSVAKSDPSLKIGDIGKAIGKMWKELTPEQKLKYEDLARDDKVRYTADIEKYNQALFHSDTGK